LERRLRPHIAGAIDWLSCHEHQQIFLLQQNDVREQMSLTVTPAKAGIQKIKALDTGFRRCDG
jgi:hypothetical protein